MQPTRSSLEKIESGQRDLWIVSSVVLLALSGGFAMLWPAVQVAASERFGAAGSPRALLGGQLLLVFFLVVYLWHKGAQIGRLTRSLAHQRGRTEGLEIHLDTVRSLLQATAQLPVDRGQSEGLAKVLEELTVALKGDRSVLHRVTTRGTLERDAAFPTSSRAPDPKSLAFEDEVAARVAASGQILGWGGDAAEHGFENVPARRRVRSLIAAPVVLDGDIVGVVSVRNPMAIACDSLTAEDRELVGVFASFAAGVVRNLRLFQKVADKNAELDRAHGELRRAQSDLAEVDTATTLTCIANTMAHTLSGPLTAMRGYVDVLRQTEPRSRDALRARTGLEREFFTFRDRLQTILDTLSQLRCRYELVDLDNLVKEAAETWRLQNPDSAITVEVEPYGHLPLTVVDSLRIRQVLLTVLRYAGRTAESARADRSVRIATSPQTGLVHVEFRLQGCSDLEKPLRRLLDPHVELADLRRADGLELAVASGIVRQHCGEVAFESEDDRITLRVTLPIRRDAPPPPRRVFPLSCGLEEGSAGEVLHEILSAGIEPSVAVETTEPVTAPAIPAIDTRGLFGPGDLWAAADPGGAPPLPAAPPQPRQRSPSVRAEEVANVLSVLDVEDGR